MVSLKSQPQAFEALTIHRVAKEGGSRAYVKGVRTAEDTNLDMMFIDTFIDASMAKEVWNLEAHAKEAWQRKCGALEERGSAHR